ncbi:MAG: enoyl-CoA hydratase-related protein, partial [Melioribacteraceae bacterium]|nr:enoyl-CoA hydratase-related protein [Melioribacteraceae bacterium]
MEYTNLILEKSEGVALLTINRPDKLNALNSLTLEELNSALNEIKKDDTVSVVILTGAGEKAFVAGADIGELSACSKETGKSFAQKGQLIFNLVENLGKPVIAAVNGFALGGGCELALSCHIRLASENAKFGQPEVNLGIIPGYGGTQRLPRVINYSRAAEYILTGDLIDASNALRIGLVSSIFPQETLIEKAREIADKIAGKGQIAVRLALQSILNTNKMNLENGLEREAELFAECCGSEDFKEGTRAFLEKRKPNFKN